MNIRTFYKNKGDRMVYDPLKNEHQIELTGITGSNPFARNNSGGRSVMYGSHLSQHIPIEGCDEKIVQGGMDRQFAPYTFNVSMPNSGRILKIIKKYPEGNSQENLGFNPETIAIYEYEDDDGRSVIDYFSIPHYCSYDQLFGFKYKRTENINKIKYNEYIEKGTVFADSPGVSENGSYCPGANLNVAYMSIPSVSEDGIMISRDALHKFKFKIYERRVVEFGSREFPLNIHGTIDDYKIFPDIGDYINKTRKDGILMMLRSYNPSSYPVEMSRLDTMEPKFIFDKAVYVRGGDGKVVDIEVYRSNARIRQLPEEMCSQIEKYERAFRNFHKEIANTEYKLRMDRKKKYGIDNLRLSPKFHNLVTKSLAIINHDEVRMKHPLNLLHRNDPIDEYRIEFIIEYDVIPSNGYKLSDMHGGK